MKRFLFRLIAPRPTFPGDITPEERIVMQQHVSYWNGLVEQGVAVVFGPVLDPNGVWGVAVAELEDNVSPETIKAQDPVAKARLGRYEIHPMAPGTITRKTVR